MVQLVATKPTVAGDLDVHALRGALGVSRERMGQLLAVSGKTVERWESRDALPLTDPLRVARLAAIREIVELGTIVYTANGFKRFLRLPLAEFGGRTALDMVALGDTEPVFAALAADYEGLGF